MFSRIMIPIDMASPEPGVRSCARARDMVDIWGSQVHLMSVLPGYSMPMVASFFPADAVDKMRASVEKDLAEIGAKYFSSPPQITVSTGKRAHEIITLAKDWKADLIVFGCRPKDAIGGELMLGSCGLAVAERAPCNVLIAR